METINDFAYARPETLRDASRMLKKGGGRARIHGGGSDLLDLLKSRIATPETVVDLKRIAGLDRIRETGEGLEIGALATLADIAASPVVAQRYTVLARAAAESASPQLRNVGTLGGNLCQRPRCWYFRSPQFPCLRKGGDTCYAVEGENKTHCVVGGGPCFIVHPSDPAVALTALDARVRIFKGKKERTVPLADLYLLPEEDVEREVDLEPGEIVTGVVIPAPAPGTVSGYTKFKFRQTWDFAVVSVGMVLEREGGAVRRGRVALGGVAPVPWLEKTAGEALAGFDGSEGALEALGEAVLADATPLEQNGYKLPLARNLVKRMAQELTD